ncbi:MAG TPA: hypothetical protein K8U93_05805 [Mammaliicoccus lentus]|nr:hypothetical protein [Mammaliicoccus lentus]
MVDLVKTIIEKFA